MDNVCKPVSAADNLVFVSDVFKMKDYNNLTELPGYIRSLDGMSVTDPAAATLSRKAYVVDDWVSGQDTARPATFQRVTVEVYANTQLLVRLSRLAYMGT